MYVAKSAIKVILALILSYGVWGVIRLNHWTAALRQRDLYYMYQAFFLPFLLLFFLIYLLFHKERICKALSLLGYGIAAGYFASLLSLCLWPLLAHNGLDKFLHMGWALPELPLGSFFIGGWLNGLIMATVLWLMIWGNARQQIISLGIMIVVLVLRLFFAPESLMRDLLPFS